MSERLWADLEESRWPTEQDCKQKIGMAHLGIIPLPRIEDDQFEQPQVNHQLKKSIYKNNSRGALHGQVNLLIFGGTKWVDREPNPDEFNDQCLLLTIDPASSKNPNTFTLQHLPGASLRCPDKFYANMQVRCDVNQNTVTVIGHNAAHRINTGRRNPTHLRWKKLKPSLGIGQVMMDNEWQRLIQIPKNLPLSDNQLQPQQSSSSYDHQQENETGNMSKPNILPRPLLQTIASE